ncbi:MAG: DNA recombination/repair protein RecA, partial [Acidimicrobiia bacterium]|nr:DNA recombination/repair protein RecA [Acidimicrobiia bacterium]
IESIKDGSDFTGNRVKAKIVKNKVAPPFKIAEFDIMFGRGISGEGSLIDVAVEHDIVRKSGAWYTYEGDQLGQGREKAKLFLQENPDVAIQLQARVLEAVGLAEPVGGAEATGDEAIDADGAGAEQAEIKGSKSAKGSVKGEGKGG